MPAHKEDEVFAGAKTVILKEHQDAAFVQALEATEPTADLRRLMSLHSRVATP